MNIIDLTLQTSCKVKGPTANVAAVWGQTSTGVGHATLVETIELSVPVIKTKNYSEKW